MMVSIKNLKSAMTRLYNSLTHIQLESYYMANNKTLYSLSCGVPLSLFVLAVIPYTLTRHKMSYDKACLRVNQLSSGVPVSSFY